MDYRGSRRRSEIIDTDVLRLEIREKKKRKKNNLTRTCFNIALQFSSSIVITAYVDDVNDNSPYFINTPYAADISESTPIGK